MLKLSKNLLLRRGTRVPTVYKFDAFTPEDIENDKLLGPMHEGRLKSLQVEDLKQYDNEISKPKYALDMQESLASQIGLVHQTENNDQLYSHVDLEISAHDNKVLNSYLGLGVWSWDLKILALAGIKRL